MIGEASGTLVTSGGRFRHSFEVDTAAISPDPTQARKTFDMEEIAGLANTMADQGQLQPILLRRDTDTRGRWIIIAGERRWRAAQLNGWSTVLAIEHNGDPEVAALIENLQRVDLSPVEEARGLQRLIAEKNWSQDRAAAALGKSKSDVSAMLGILDLPEELLDRVLTSELLVSKNVLIELARVEGEGVQKRLVKLAMEGGLTIRAIRQARSIAEKPEPAAAEPAASTFDKGRLMRMGQYLAAWRPQTDKLSEHDRLALHNLRAEINALLRD